MTPEYFERVVRFGEGDRLSGITTRPRHDSAPGDRTWCILPNSGVVPRSGVARLHVRLARALAKIGVSTLRFDLSGLGDSERSPVATDPSSQARADLQAASGFLADEMRSRGDVLMGLCSAAYDTLGAMDGSPSVRGVVMIDLIADFKTSRQVVEHYRSRFRRPESWGRAIADPRQALSDLVGRLRRERTRGGGLGESGSIGVRPMISQEQLRTRLRLALDLDVDLLFLFSGGLEDNYNYEEQFSEAFAEVSGSERVEHRYFPEARHIFDDVEQQTALIRTICSWTESRMPGWLADRR